MRTLEHEEYEKDFRINEEAHKALMNVITDLFVKDVLELLKKNRDEMKSLFRQADDDSKERSEETRSLSIKHANEHAQNFETIENQISQKTKQAISDLKISQESIKDQIIMFQDQVRSDITETLNLNTETLSNSFHELFSNIDAKITVFTQQIVNEVIDKSHQLSTSLLSESSQMTTKIVNQITATSTHSDELLRQFREEVHQELSQIPSEVIKHFDADNTIIVEKISEHVSQLREETDKKFTVISRKMDNINQMLVHWIDQTEQVKRKKYHVESYRFVAYVTLLTLLIGLLLFLK